MKSFLNIVRFDYLQRTRSYAFLITLCASLAIAYTFVPEPEANYATIRIGEYSGFYNSAWFGYATAIMTSVFLSLIGFYLVNSGIKIDRDSKVGQIIACTKISNFKYLLSKAISNFLVLLTIVFVIFLMSILLFFLFNDNSPFQLIQFIKPYTLIVLPMMFFTAVLAVIFEVLLGSYPISQNILYFFLFSTLLLGHLSVDWQFALDVFGNKIVMNHFEETVQQLEGMEEKPSISIGYVIPDVKSTKKLLFEGLDFPVLYLIARFSLILVSLLLLTFITPFFHRFDRKTSIRQKKYKPTIETPTTNKDLGLVSLSIPQTNFSLFPLLKTEILLLLRKGSKWLWLLNLTGIGLLAFIPIPMSHQIILPILWFLQVARLSDLSTKEFSHQLDPIAFTSYKPVRRLFVSQLLSSILLIQTLALPLTIRLILVGEFSGAIAILLGGCFLVLIAALLGLLSKGKKLFEVLFFFLSYACINGFVILDYMGGYDHDRFYLWGLGLSVVALMAVVFTIRSRQVS